jgi:hypothetical protein
MVPSVSLTSRWRSLGSSGLYGAYFSSVMSMAIPDRTGWNRTFHIRADRVRKSFPSWRRSLRSETGLQHSRWSVLVLIGHVSNRAEQQDTTRFIKSSDVMSIYNSVVKQGELDVKAITVNQGSTDTTVTKLNSVRDEQISQTSGVNGGASSSRSHAPPDPNRVDTILSDVFALLSLFFLTIGKSRETPATYCQIVGMRVSPFKPILQVGANE